ncbi:hypothetical protein LZ31DRAFT_384078 [Colletotrichum somersetense]|nr:hypothetical protein LZ31DRAFT_384078 [Colletotrichum somersetense]
MAGGIHSKRPSFTCGALLSKSGVTAAFEGFGDSKRPLQNSLSSYKRSVAPFQTCPPPARHSPTEIRPYFRYQSHWPAFEGGQRSPRQLPRDAVEQRARGFGDVSRFRRPRDQGRVVLVPGSQPSYS